MSENANKEQWNGEQYAQNSQPQQKIAYEILESVPFTSHDTVLDVGCGDGKISAYVAQKYVPQGNVVGIDSSSSMIEYAARQFPSVQNLSFTLADAQSLSLLERSFDRAVSFHVLHWIQNQQAVFQNIYDHLKVGGSITLVCGSGDTYSTDEFVCTMRRVARGSEFAHYLTNFREEEWISVPKKRELEAYLEVVGFRGTVSCMTSRLTHPTLQSLIDVVSAVMPHKTYMPEHIYDEFVAQVVDDYVQTVPPNKDGGHLRMLDHLIVRAVK